MSPDFDFQKYISSFRFKQFLTTAGPLDGAAPVRMTSHRKVCHSGRRDILLKTDPSSPCADPDENFRCVMRLQVGEHSILYSVTAGGFQVSRRDAREVFPEME